MALATNGPARSSTMWDGTNVAAYVTDPGDYAGGPGADKGRMGGHYASDGAVGYIPAVWAGKLIH